MAEYPNRRDVVRALLEDRGELMVIAGLGASAWDITAIGDTPRNLPLWGGMGGAAMMGLGLALAQPSAKVLVITGDGEMLMALGAMATIAVQRPKNLSIVVLDNEHYSETGNQETATKHGVDLAAMARGAGLSRARTLTTLEEVPALRADIHAATGTIFAVQKIAPGNLPLVLPPRDGAILQARFREALLGPAAHHQL
ncbi:thiamine pyrophosphate-dependent enzyme [Falsiroseomonas sp.]|uniref:thiamine pyrophosphate-dependent enzyme n=1 Tax=Falsiroseomonas sp. TaxID=2870721 RepID=UPI00271ABB10|nr:thiamine pyrophosphate-dependent enzyme [Falsiroseomonas sp.]MDO9501711.1 thiamine pyrophosphate-dependent enzyme [Falsiroseomonas sp.]